MTQPLHASLWIKPTATARDPCRDACDRARGRYGGPRIEPHVTLLGGIESTPEDAGKKLKQLAARIPPFELKLKRVGIGHEYFHRLFVIVALTPELRDARRAAEEIFEQGPGRYDPHLSLVYGDQALDHSATAGFEQLLDLSFTVESLYLVTAARGVPVEEWRTLAESTLRPESGAE